MQKFKYEVQPDGSILKTPEVVGEKVSADMLDSEFSMRIDHAQRAVEEAKAHLDALRAERAALRALTAPKNGA